MLGISCQLPISSVFGSKVYIELLRFLHADSCAPLSTAKKPKLSPSRENAPERVSTCHLCLLDVSSNLVFGSLDASTVCLVDISFAELLALYCVSRVLAGVRLEKTI